MPVKLPPDIHNLSIYFVGIKGTGMSALAELFLRRGATVSGSDTEEKFYTDTVLQELGIPYKEGFAAENIPERTDYVIYSAAYDPSEHEELLEAKRREIPILEYTHALGELSRDIHATGVAGVHGKTTTTAMIGSLIQGLELPGSVLVGSAVKSFHNRATYYHGDRFFIAETCEYRRHFLSFHPKQLLVTTVDVDHLDYYRDYEDIESAFIEYALKLPEGGRLVYCADDPGAALLAEKVQARREDILTVPYGTKADGAFRIVENEIVAGHQRMRLAGWSTDFQVRIPGQHSLLNAAGALAALEGTLEPLGLSMDEDLARRAAAALQEFAGSKRRSEILGEAKGILFVDDYGHHPKEISTTLEGFKAFYPERRIIIDFMSHTYTRTEALLDDFSSAFGDADVVILHKIYGSAREKAGSVNGRTLFERVKARHPEVYYFHEVESSRDFLHRFLQPGDLFITMGAGNNWQVGISLLEEFKGRNSRND